MFTLSKGEPPTPPTNANLSTDEIGTTPCELPQLQKMEAPNRSRSIPIESTSTFANKPTTEIGMAARALPPLRKPSGPLEQDSGFEASPCSMTGTGPGSYFFDDDVFENEDEDEAEDDNPSLLLEREDNWCPNCSEDSSCSGSRAESTVTVVRAAVGTDPNTCDSDCTDRSPSPQSPPPSSWPIPASCNHIHNDRLPCPRCSGGGSLRSPTSSMSCQHHIVASRSYPGSYPANVLNWLRHSTPAFSPRVSAALSRTSNRSDDRRSYRSRRSQGDSETSSSSSFSCDEQSDDELFACEGDLYLGDLGNMREAEQLRAPPPDHLPDIVPEPEEQASRRFRSQSVSIPLDHARLREIGSTLRRLSNEFENRMAERNGQRRSSLAEYFSW